MPKNNLTVRRVLTLFLAYLMLALAGGVVATGLLVPAVFGANNVAKAVIPSLQVEGVDFDVTSLPQKSVMYANDGKTKFAEFYAQNREVVPIKDISKHMQHAVVAREDKRFFQHSGVDVQGVLRAFVQTYVVGGDQQGGSSLTQQYVKNVLSVQAEESGDSIAQYHASEDTIARKVREMLIAVQMEKKYSKFEILQGYLNIAQFGSNSLCGVETAAKRYFNVSAKDLNVVQSATIAAITKNPAKFDPSIEANQPEAQKQRNIVLDLMLDQNYITQQEHDEASAMPIKDTLNLQSVDKGCMYAGYDAGYFCNYVTKRILNSEEFGKTRAERQKLLDEGGLKIVTTLDIDANTLMMQEANNTIPAADPSGMEIVMASVKPGTGEVLGFGLNRQYDETDAAQNDPTKSGMNYAVDAVDGGGNGFPIGSSWKPINLIAWMEAGRSINENLTTTTKYATNLFNCDRYSGSPTDVWDVTNALTNSTVNPETPFLGLVRSHNTTMASMGAQIGLCKIADAAKEVGYHNAIPGHEDVFDSVSLTPALVIGGSTSVSPLTMANVFATYAANGVACDPIALKQVTDRNGKDIKVPSANCHQAVDPGIIQTLAYTMNQGTVRSDGAGYAGRLSDGRKSFIKTGTNEDTYVTTGGFLPGEIATFVLVGDVQNPNENRIANIAINGEYHGYWDGATIAAPAWRRFTEAYIAKKGVPANNDYGQPDQRFMAYTGVSARSRTGTTGTTTGTTGTTTGTTTGQTN